MLALLLVVAVVALLDTLLAVLMVGNCVSAASVRLATAVVDVTDNGAVPVATVRASWLLSVFAPANVCVPVVTRPRADAPASGIAKVKVLALPAIVKSVPVVAAAKVTAGPVCAPPVGPVILVMPMPATPALGSHRIAPRPFVVSTYVSVP